MLSSTSSQQHREGFFNPFHRSNPVVSSPPNTLSLKSPPTHDRIEPVLKPVPIYKEDSFDLSIKGQGVVAVRATNATALRFEISPVESAGPTLYVSVIEEAIQFAYGFTGQPVILLDDVLQPKETTHPGARAERKLLRPTVEATYWLSIDGNHGWLRYGKDYLAADRTVAQVNLKHLDEKEGVWVWDKPEYKGFEEWKQVTVKIGNSHLTGEPALKTVYPLPIVNDLSPYIVSDEKVTLAQLATGLTTVPANLPAECQHLYANVAGPSIVLDDEEDVREGFVFSRAIERSVITPGLLGYEKLKAKAGEFGREDFEGTYLRITLGLDKGDSPGVPYVLEIWPAGHYSPIHNHSDAYAVIKVLHGEIEATYYDSLDIPVYQVGPAARLKQGDITWLSPTNYQVHKLHNTSTEGRVCCTIQCYEYGTADLAHYKFFNYLADVDGDSKPDIVQRFEPNSDWDFLHFKELIRDEWERRDKGLGRETEKVNGNHA